MEEVWEVGVVRWDDVVSCGRGGLSLIFHHPSQYEGSKKTNKGRPISTVSDTERIKVTLKNLALGCSALLKDVASCSSSLFRLGGS